MFIQFFKVLTFDHKPPVANGKVMEYNTMVADYNTEVSDYNIIETRKMKAGVEKQGLFKEKKKMAEVEEIVVEEMKKKDLVDQMKKKDMVDHMKKKSAEFEAEMEEYLTFKEDVYKKKVDEFNLTLDEYNLFKCSNVQMFKCLNV